MLAAWFRMKVRSIYNLEKLQFRIPFLALHEGSQHASPGRPDLPDVPYLPTLTLILTPRLTCALFFPFLAHAPPLASLAYDPSHILSHILSPDSPHPKYPHLADGVIAASAPIWTFQGEVGLRI